MNGVMVHCASTQNGTPIVYMYDVVDDVEKIAQDLQAAQDMKSQ